MIYYGDFNSGSMVYMTLNTFDSDGASCTVTNLAATDVHIHKAGAIGQRSSASGVTVAIDFDSITGNHLIAIDLSDNADAGFYAIAKDYSVRVEGITVDGNTINAWVGSFSIENRHSEAQDISTLATSAKQDLQATLTNQGLQATSAGQALQATATTQALQATAAGQALQATLANQTAMKGATFDTLTDSLEAIRNRGDAAWLTGGGGGGSSTVTLTITDGSNPVADASVQIWNTALNILVSYATTNVSGVVTLTADDGSYKVKIRKAGYSFSTQNLTVSGNTSATYTGSTVVIPATSDPTLCRVYEYIRQPDGTFPTTCVGYCKIASLPYNSNTSIYSGVAITGTYNNITGVLYWDVPRGSTIQVSITNYGYDYDKNYTTPSAASARLSLL